MTPCFCTYTKDTRHDIIIGMHFHFLFMCKVCTFSPLGDVTPYFVNIKSRYAELKLKQQFYSMCLMGATILHFISALCVSQYHVQNALSVWSLEDVLRNSHDFRITYIIPGCKQRPHPILSNQPISSGFYSVLTNHRWADDNISFKEVLTHPNWKCFQQESDWQFFVLSIWLSNVTLLVMMVHFQL